MAINWQWKSKIGTLELRSSNGTPTTYQVNIYEGSNCLAVFIVEWHDTETNNDLYRVSYYLMDIYHAKRWIKGNDTETLFGDKVISIKLNLYYKESHTILNIFTKHGYTVECFYQKPQDND